MRKVVLIADLVESRKLGERGEVQEQLQAALTVLNGMSEDALASPYTITLGDEFQAVFHRADTIFRDAFHILSALYPVQVRFSFGIGEIVTRINPQQAIGMDGPAFHAARDGMERLKQTKHLFTVEGGGVAIDPLIPHSLQFISHEIATWVRVRLSIMAEYSLSSLHGHQMGDVEQIAIRVGISPRAVYKNLDAGAMRDLARIFTDITNALNAQLEE